MPKYEVTSDVTRFDFNAIHAFLSQAYWSLGLPKQVLASAIANSICFGVLHNGGQVAFARVVTDKATFGYLADVYVLEEHRGQGLSILMMEAVKVHPELQGLRRMLLVTRDAHALYRKFGFVALAAPEKFMEIHNPSAYGVA